MDSTPHAGGICESCWEYSGFAKADAAVRSRPGEVGVTMMSLDGHSSLVPLHQSFKKNAVAWLTPIATIDDDS
jgi:hypothetical protein